MGEGRGKKHYLGKGKGLLGDRMKSCVWKFENCKATQEFKESFFLSINKYLIKCEKISSIISKAE